MPEVLITAFSHLGQNTSHHEALMAFFNPSGQITRYNLKLCHGRYLLHAPKFSIHYINSSYNILVKISSLNNPLINKHFWLGDMKIKSNMQLMVVTTPNVYFNFEIQHEI